MSENRILLGSVRAIVGLVVVAAAAAALLLLGNVDVPTVSRDARSITVDTTQHTDRSLVCAGAFAELGADPDDPSAAVPTGEAGVAVAGTPADTATLERAAGGAPTVVTAPSDEALGAAQIQAVETETLRGAAASACGEPLNEQWLVGGGSSLGVSTTITLGNPGTVAATAELTVYDEDGQVDAVQTAGILVPPGTAQTVSLNGYAPDRDRFAVRVVSTGAPVTATLGIGQVSGLDPFAVSSATRQPEPAERLVVPGIANVSDREMGPSDAGEGDAFPVIVHALAPGGETGSARVWAVDKNGKRTDLGDVPLAGGAVGELRIATWPKGAEAAVIESDAPIVAGLLGTAIDGRQRDAEWFAPAPRIAADTPVGAPVVAGGRLVIANLGEEEARVTITGAGGKAKTIKVAAGAATSTAAPASAVIESSGPVYAGVRYVSGGDIAGYPILAPDPRDGELTVYTRGA